MNGVVRTLSSLKSSKVRHPTSGRPLKRNASKDGGESGIRTHVRVSPKHAFQACAFSHSAISPARQATPNLQARLVPLSQQLWRQSVVAATGSQGRTCWLEAVLILWAGGVGRNRGQVFAEFEPSETEIVNGTIAPAPALTIGSWEYRRSQEPAATRPGLSAAQATRASRAPPALPALHPAARGC